MPAAAALKAGDEPPPGRAGAWALALCPVRSDCARAAHCRRWKAFRFQATFDRLPVCSAACFSTPGLATMVFSRLQPEGPAWRQVAVAQLRGTARRANISIAAILVSFSLMVAMAIMVFSFRMSLEDWVQRILPADLYVRAGTSARRPILIRRRTRVIASLPGVERVRVRPVPGHRVAR